SYLSWRRLQLRLLLRLCHLPRQNERERERERVSLQLLTCATRTQTKLAGAFVPYSCRQALITFACLGSFLECSVDTTTFTPTGARTPASPPPFPEASLLARLHSHSHSSLATA